MMKRIFIFLLPAWLCAQTSINTLRIIPTPTHSAVGVAQFWDKAQDFYTGLAGADTIGSSVTFRLPSSDGMAGQCMATDGFGNLSLTGTCTALTPPITFSATTTGNILTVTQLGSGNALVVNGPASATTNSSSANAFTVTQSGTGNSLVVSGPSSVTANSASASALIVTQSGSANGLVVTGPSSVTDNSSNTAFSVTESGAGDALHVSGGAKFTGLVASNSSLWSLSAIGLGFAQDYTARYVFNSIGDVPQTGTANTSGTTFTTTSGTVDASWVGGQILICAGGCTGLNGTLFLVSAYVNSTTLTLGTSAGSLTGAGYSYQANAFQTSTGTTYTTGSGFIYAQNIVVTDGFTSYGASAATGTVTCSGTSVTLTGGDKFRPDMAGGNITINGVTSSALFVSSVQTDHNLTVSTVCTSGSYSYTGNAFQLYNHAASIDPSGNGTLSTVTATGGSMLITSTGDSTFTAQGAGLGGTGNLLLVGNAGTNCWNAKSNSGSSYIIGYTSSCTSAFSLTTELTMTPTGNTFAQPITVPSCTGCVSSSNAVQSFNTRQGIVTLTATDVTNAGASGSFTVTTTGDATLQAIGSALGGNAVLNLAGNNSSNCWLHQAGGGSSMVLSYVNSCGGTFSPTTEITFTPSGTTFAQAITVPSCTGCGGGVTSVTGGTGISTSPATGAVIVTNTGVTTFNTRTGAVTLSSTDVSNAGGNGSFAVTSASDAALQATASAFSAASLLLHGNNNANCWDWVAGTGAAVIMKYSNSCGGGYSPTTEVTFSSTGTTFVQPITVPSCTGCGSGVTSITFTSPLTGGTITGTGTVGCASCITSAVTSAAAGTGISVSGATGAVTFTNTGVTSAVAGTGVGVSASTGAVTFSIGQAVGTGNSPTFNIVTATNGFAVPGFAISDGSANLAGNSLTLTGITTNSGGQLVCVTVGGLLYRTATVC